MNIVISLFFLIHNKLVLYLGLTSYLMMAIYCQGQFDETVSLKWIRPLKSTIRNELRVNNVVRETNYKLVKK